MNLIESVPKRPTHETIPSANLIRNQHARPPAPTRVLPRRHPGLPTRWIPKLRPPGGVSPEIRRLRASTAQRWTAAAVIAANFHGSAAGRRVAPSRSVGQTDVSLPSRSGSRYTTDSSGDHDAVRLPLMMESSRSPVRSPLKAAARCTEH